MPRSVFFPAGFGGHWGCGILIMGMIMKVIKSDKGLTAVKK